MHAKPRLFRDPIYDTISWDPGTLIGRVVLSLLDTAEVQRLRRIRQLGLSHLVYHGAEHSRFSHSMGVTWVAHQMMQTVSRWQSIDEDEWAVTLAAALCHDIGHGPFSHAFEAATRLRHESLSIAMLEGEESHVNRVLREIDPGFPERVSSRLKGNDESPPFLREIVSSQLDADRMDYIRRDGHATGVRIGTFDLERVLAMLDVVDGHLAVHVGATEAVEGYLLARFHMYKQVYLHKTVRAAECMLEAALRRAGVLRREGRSPSYWPNDALGVLLEHGEVQLAGMTLIDDVDVWRCMKAWSSAEDRVLADLASGLVRRRLYKTVILSEVQASSDALVDEVRAFVSQKGYDPDYHLIWDTSRDSPYRPYKGGAQHAKSIRLTDGGGLVSFIEERSEVIRMLGGLEHTQHILCVHPDLKAPIQRLLSAPTMQPAG